jgi:hypothetical protein
MQIRADPGNDGGEEKLEAMRASYQAVVDNLSDRERAGGGKRRSYSTATSNASLADSLSKATTGNEGLTDAIKLGMASRADFDKQRLDMDKQQLESQQARLVSDQQAAREERAQQREWEASEKAKERADKAAERADLRAERKEEAAATRAANMAMLEMGRDMLMALLAKKA